MQPVFVFIFSCDVTLQEVKYGPFFSYPSGSVVERMIVACREISDLGRGEPIERELPWLGVLSI